MSMPAATAAATLPQGNRALLVVSIMLATLMQVIDTTIANVALPHMMASMSATVCSAVDTVGAWGATPG